MMTMIIIIIIIVIMIIMITTIIMSSLTRFTIWVWYGEVHVEEGDAMGGLPVLAADQNDSSDDAEL